MLLVCLIFVAGAEAVVENNRNYGYIYWEYGIPTLLSNRRPQSQANTVARNNPNVIIQTGYYSLRLDCDDMELTGYDSLTGSDYMTALYQDVTSFSSAELNLYVYKDGVRYECVSGLVLDTEDTNNPHVRLIENGRFVQRFDHTGLIFEDPSGTDLGVKGRLEITAWPDRVVFMLDFRDYNGDPLTTGITRTTIQLISPLGQTHLADTMNDQVFLTLMPHLDQTHADWNASSYITDAYNFNTQASLNYSFDQQEHALKVEVPASSISWPSDIDRVDEYLIEVTNPQASSVNIPIVFNQSPPRAITGTVMVLCEEADGAPTGIPVQISKNWHGASSDIIHRGSWLRGSTVFMLDAGETKRLRLKVIYGHWAGVPAASYAQLCLIGWNRNWKWDESALGAWGENMTFDPTLHAGSAFMCDVRPAFTTSYNTSRTTHNWTENVGGGEFLIYFDSTNKYRWAKRIKTAYRWTGPNMTEVLYSGVTDDDKIRFTYTTQLPRTYDYQRRFQNYKYEFLQDVTSPQRLVFYQMAADYYTGPNFDNYYFGNDSGLLSSELSDPGGNAYNGSFPFYDRWLSIDDIITGDKTCYSHRGMLWRKSTLNGSDFTPYFHTYGRTWGSDKMLFDLSSDSVNRSYAAGDVVEGEIEYVMPAKATTGYWGLDSEFSGRLGSYTNAWEAVFDEHRYNDLTPTMHTGTLIKSYPVEIEAALGDVLADFTINDGGIGHVPIVVTNVPKGTPVSAQRYIDGAWQWLESVDITGNDYYQGYQNADGKMDYVFNINRPSTNLNESWRVRILKGTDGTISTSLDELQALAGEWLQASSAFSTLWDLDFSSDIVASGEFTDRDPSTSAYNYTDMVGMLHLTAPSIFDSVDKYYLEDDVVVSLSAKAHDTAGVALWQDFLVNDSQRFVCWIRVMVDASDPTKQVVEFLKGFVDWGTFDTQGTQDAVYVYDFPADTVLTVTGTYYIDKTANTVSFDWQVSDGTTSQSDTGVVCSPLASGGEVPWGVSLWGSGTGYYDGFNYQLLASQEIVSDFNSDGKVNLEDFARIASNWLAD